MTTSRNIVDQLRQLRVNSKMAQFDFAETTGYNRSQIALYESGKRVPSLSAVVDMANALGHTLVVTKARHKKKLGVRHKHPQDHAALALHYMELGYRACEEGRTLGQAFRTCPTIRRDK